MGSVAADPFVTLTAVAGATTRLRLITSIVALARRRPQLVVQAAATLDLASDGRLVLGLGAGEDEPDFTAFGDDFDRPRASVAWTRPSPSSMPALRGEHLEHDGPLLVARGVVSGRARCSSPGRPSGWAPCGPAASGERRAGRAGSSSPSRWTAPR